jgi:uncharacterized protein (DUF58 family)
LPNTPLQQLKAEAQALAAELGSLSTQARAASAAQLGSAGRRRSGPGENFWQYRRHMAEDGVQRVDWRRSAREDHLFVRETELETSRTFLFWVDPSPGFDFSSDSALPTKADRALVLAMALAGALSRSGERCGALGGARGPSVGARAPTRVGEDNRRRRSDEPFPGAPRETAACVIASDFYETPETWRKRLRPLSARCRDGALLQVVDPLEATFPFEGRMRFSRPGENRERVIGRAQSVREAYLERFARRRDDMIAIAAEFGWRFVSCSTADTPSLTLGTLARGFERHGARL